MPFVLIYTSENLDDASFLDPANWKIFVVADDGVLVQIDHHPAHGDDTDTENDDEDIELETPLVSDDTQKPDASIKSKL